MTCRKVAALTALQWYNKQGLTFRPAGTCCIFVIMFRATLAVSINSGWSNVREGHLEGRRRAGVLAEDDRVICHMEKTADGLQPGTYPHV